MAAIVLGIVGIITFVIVIPPLLAFIFGLVAASQIKGSRGRQSGLGMARAGWILGAIGLAAAATLIPLVATGVIDVDETALDDLERGDCVESDLDEQPLGEDTEVSSLPVVDCDEPHDAEVTGTARLNPDEDRDYPSQDELAREASQLCVERFREHTGAEPGALIPLYIVSNEESWDELRGLVVCLAFDAAGDDLEGSIAD